jgi:hypothetical protein
VSLDEGLLRPLAVADVPEEEAQAGEAVSLVPDAGDGGGHRHLTTPTGPDPELPVPNRRGPRLREPGELRVEVPARLLAEENGEGLPDERPAIQSQEEARGVVRLLDGAGGIGDEVRVGARSNSSR